MKNTGILYVRMGITVFISLYSTRLILNSLGVDDFGIFNVVAGSIAMLTFLNTAMAAATQRFMSFAQGAGDFDKLKSIFNVSLVLHLSIAILVLLLLEGVGYILLNGVLKIPEARVGAAKIIFQFAIASTFFTIISVPYDAVINAHENMFLFAILGILEALIKLAIAIYITYTAYDQLLVYGLLMALMSIFLLVIRQVYCTRKYEECRMNVKKYFSKPIFSEMTSFAGWSFLGSSSSMVANYGQGIIMNVFFGTVVNTAQGISGQVSGQLGAFAVTMLKALNPLIAKSEGANNRELLVKATFVGSKASFFLLMIFYVPVLIEMPYIFKIWLKNVPDFAVIFCRLLLLRNLVEQLYITLSASIAATGNIRKYQIYISVLTFFPLVVSYVLFYFGAPAYAMYIVFIIYTTLTAIMTIYFAQLVFNLPVKQYLVNVILRCLTTLLITASISIMPLLLMSPSIERLACVLLISTLSFTVTAYLFGFSPDEKKQIVILIQKIGTKLRPKSSNLHASS